MKTVLDPSALAVLEELAVKTAALALVTPCSKCEAEPGAPCRARGGAVVYEGAYHPERLVLATAALL